MPTASSDSPLGVPLLVITAAGTLVAALSLDPIAQPLGYHAFADDRRVLGVDNFWNVASNLAFLVFGLSGLVFTLRARPQGARRSWTLFFATVALVAFGSAWYHLAPDNIRLVWDRLPIAVATAAFFVALLTEHVGPTQERWLVRAALAGAATVAYWHFTDDLRFYLWLQVFVLISVPLFVLLFEPRHPGRRWLLTAFALFVIARLTEYYDAGIYIATNALVGGHALKHLLAGFASLALQIMLLKRPRNADSNAPSEADTQRPA